jgi:hypothetical protein
MKRKETIAITGTKVCINKKLPVAIINTNPERGDRTNIVIRNVRVMQVALEKVRLTINLGKW